MRARGLKELSQPCQEANRGHGDACRDWVSWPATGGGCGDRNYNPGAYGILTDA